MTAAELDFRKQLQVIADPLGLLAFHSFSYLSDDHKIAKAFSLRQKTIRGLLMQVLNNTQKEPTVEVSQLYTQIESTVFSFLVLHTK